MKITTFLIIGGVILLVIAIILLIVQKVKTNKDNAKATAQPAQAPVQDPNMMNGQMPVDPNQAMMAQAPVQDPNMMNPGVQPVMDPAAQMPAQAPVTVVPDPNAGAQLPGVQVPANQPAPEQIVPPAPENNLNSMPEVTVLPVEAAPVDASGDATAPSFEAQPATPAPAPAPVAPQPAAPQPAPVQPEVAPVAPAPVAPQPAQPAVYGGANPTIPQINIDNNEPKQIYGGADPLENTQPIPQSPAPVVPAIQTDPVAQAPAAPQVPNIAAAPVQPAAQQPGVPPIQTS